MDYIILFLAALSAIHAYSYGNWLRKNKQTAAFFVIALCAVISLVLPLYHIYSK